MKTSNPILNDRAFERVSPIGSDSQAMTAQGAVNKTCFLTALLMLTAGCSWMATVNQLVHPMILIAAGGILGLITALVIIVSNKTAPFLAPIYVIFEGTLLGSVSSFAENYYHGIVAQAVALTFGVLFLMLVMYKTEVIKVTQKFRMGIIAATGAIFIVYLVSFILSFFGVHVPFIYESGLIGIGFSLFVVTIAALNLVLDFDFIDQGAQMSLPKYMEWYAAFGLMVTLIWLYIEILNLLAKLRSR